MDAHLAATSTDAVAPGKRHYVVLDGLRGVAALLVVVFHLTEPFTNRTPGKQVLNHGYLAVDFFFLLSGFVISYAYDDRWSRMNQWGFYKRRLIRLQPMVVIGNVIGGALYYFQDWIHPKYHDSLWQVIIAMLIGGLLIPLPKSLTFRGWDAMYPLDLPEWSLFYEYIANVLYAVGIRKLGNVALGILIALAAAALIQLAVFSPHGDLVGGWELDGRDVYLGVVRVVFPFFAGILLQRLGLRIETKGAFAICSLMLVAALSLPRFGGTAQPWLDGLYEAACIILLFPLIVAMGAGDKRVEGRSVQIARFFGDISYPLYITHFPLIYVFTRWAMYKKIPSLERGALSAVALVISVLLAYAYLRLYDEPVRRWLSARLLRRRPAKAA